MRIDEKTASPSLAKGDAITAETWADFVARLRYDCIGEGVEDHCTADAIFIVQARRLIFGIDRDYTDQVAVIMDDRYWFSPREYWDDCDEDEKATLDQEAAKKGDCTFLDMSTADQLDLLGDLPDHTVTGWDDRWEYVCAHFTKAAADAFIARKKHDYRDGIRVYVDAQSYSWEYNTIKEAILAGRLVLAEPGSATPCQGHARQQEAEETEQLRKDAERYRLLKRGQHWSTVNGIGDTLRGEALDQAIDAALATQEAKSSDGKTGAEKQYGPDNPARLRKPGEPVEEYRAAMGWRNQTAKSEETPVECPPLSVDRAWARFCGAFGDGPDAPYPGMIAAFETHYGQSFRDKEWRSEAACWAAAWHKATEQATKAQEAKSGD